MAELELSCGLPPGPDFADLAALAEELGYARVWIYDSAPLWEDPFIHLALAAERTRRIGLATAVLVPGERSVMTMASAIAAIARLSQGRFRACFGTGLTARLVAGQRPMTLAALADYVTALRQLLAGETVILDGAAARMMHFPELTAPRPLDVDLWLSAFGPKGHALAADIADGVIGPPHPTLPSATITWGTVLEPGEDPNSARAKEALGPWRVLDWHSAYAHGGAAVDALPGGREWRASLESLAPEGERHLLTFEGHVTHLTARDRGLLPHCDMRVITRALVGEPESIVSGISGLAAAGYQEVIFAPSGPDVSRELHAFAAATRQPA
ncbi:MAG TPA: LLM class flavin-dependent oxidoreductase [Frankiaceae bacterium]|nr:LLM class flavin-dependent oxidoreductase [Frankiaceae bacterium]